MKSIIKSKKILFLFLGLSLIATLSEAQPENSILSKLQDKTWKMQGLIDKSVEDGYKNKQITHYFNNQCIGSEEYYLSDSIVTLFDSSKTGKVDNGRYIISRMVRDKDDTRPTPIHIMEVIELDGDKMVLKNIKTNIVLEYRAK